MYCLFIYICAFIYLNHIHLVIYLIFFISLFKLKLFLYLFIHLFYEFGPWCSSCSPSEGSITILTPSRTLFHMISFPGTITLTPVTHYPEATLTCSLRAKWWTFLSGLLCFCVYLSWTVFSVYWLFSACPDLLPVLGITYVPCLCYRVCWCLTLPVCPQPSRSWI